MDPGGLAIEVDVDPLGARHRGAVRLKASAARLSTCARTAARSSSPAAFVARLTLTQHRFLSGPGRCDDLGACLARPVASPSFAGHSKGKETRVLSS